MKRIFIPESAEKIINALKAAGHEAYIVGGCVRDALLGRAAYDYDITTSALPEETKAIFKKTFDTGISHGTVTVISDGVPYEVTTFRIDGEYADCRHPVSVSFTKNVEFDLARRDFTVNALCYNHETGIIDAFDGVRDLNNKIIRAVGDPELRFSEDALRVFRAIRFSATLGFEIEENTKRAIFEYKENLKNVSVERIYAEWKKLLGGTYSYDVIEEYNDVIAVCIPELKGLKLPNRVGFERLNAEEKQIALFAKRGKENFSSALQRLKVDNKTKAFGLSVITHLDLSDSMTDVDLKLYLQQIADEEALTAAKICSALGICSDEVYYRLNFLISTNTPRRISQLAISGNELLLEGYKGEEIGIMLNNLLMLVAKGELANEEKTLLSYVKSVKQSND